MNVGIFNIVNHKASSGSDGMYAEWSSLPLEGAGGGVLSAVGGANVVLSVVSQLAQSDPSPLTTDAEVEWVLEVIRYGLSLPLTSHDALRDCVRICCSWLSPLLPPAPPQHPPPPAVPAPVAAAPRRFARKILKHLHNLFVPRPNESGDLISRQALLCHRVLRLSLSLAKSAELGASEWRTLLLLLLSAASALLGPPAAHHADANQLCERVLCVLFEVWILACHRCFPTPPLWRTLREQCLRWRHREALTQQWTRASLALTASLLTHMYGPDYPKPPISEEDANLVPADMSSAAVMQAWYRILHTMGNPVDLCRPHVISQSPDFLQYSITQEDGARDPSQHKCLQALPSIFHKAMQGVAANVDAFLGIGMRLPPVATNAESPPPQRRLTGSFNTAKKTEKGAPRSSLISLSGRPSDRPPSAPPSDRQDATTGGESERPPLAPLRPKVNSIFHLFGDWLFEAALIGSTPSGQPQRAESTPPPSSLPEAPLRNNIMSYQLGRACALGTLCRALCSKQCGEEVMAPYLARCYVALRRGLRDPATAAAVVINARHIFRLDLDGVLVLVPDFLSALERILPEREPKLEWSRDNRELRKAAISLLLSMVAFPHHYRGLAVPEFPGSNEFAGMTIGSLTRGAISTLCVSGVQVEWQDTLAAPLLSALYLVVLHNAQTSANMTHSASSTATYSTDYKGACLVVRVTYLVCHRLISSWKGDLQVSLAALELLSGLAKLHSCKPDVVERKRAVRWICDYITVQCLRRPQEHSRDLHSCVVAAYSCLASWLCNDLLADHECIATLMEVVELGLSGSKSIGKPGDPPKMKDEKELKPLSLRVRDAAESLLMLILDQVDTLESSRCRLDERWLASLGHTKIRHFIADGSILLSLLEEPLVNSQEPQPTLIVIIRSGFGRWWWSVSARGMARSAARLAAAAARPVDTWGASVRGPSLCRPPHGTSHPDCSDSSFPSLEAVLRQLNDPDASTLFKLLEQQAVIEKKIKEAENNVVPEECVPPEPVTEFQTARLFLSNLGYLNISGDRKVSSPRLIALDSSGPGFSSALRRIDNCSPKLVVTGHVFCVRSGLTSTRDILASPKKDGLPGGFVNMLRGLGTAVRVSSHSGWTGRAGGGGATGGDLGEGDDDSQVPEEQTNKEPSVAYYDGVNQVLYWSDSMTEIAFVVPTVADDDDYNEADNSYVDGCSLSTRSADKSGSSWEAGSVLYERCVSETAGNKKAPPLEKTKAASLDIDKPASGSGRKNRDYSLKILIFWLEDYEDHLNLPIDELVQHCDTGLPWRRQDVATVLVSDRRNGLSLLLSSDIGSSIPGGGASGYLGGASDLGGALVSRQVLAACLRRTVCDLAQRHRLNSDTYKPPHVKRRLLIQELAQQYKKNLTEPELLESLFYPPC